MHSLASDVERKPLSRRIEFAHRRTRLHVIRDGARVDDLDPNLVERRGERCVSFLLVADMGVEGDVAGRPANTIGAPAAMAASEFDDCGKVFPCHPDRLDAVARLQRRVGDDHGDDVPDMMDFVRRHHRKRFGGSLRAIGIRKRSQTRRIAEAREIAADENRVNTRLRPRRFEVIDAKPGVPIRAAQEGRLELGALNRIGCITAPTRDQAHVLDAFDSLAHSKFGRLHRWAPLVKPFGLGSWSRSQFPNRTSPRRQ